MLLYGPCIAGETVRSLRGCLANAVANAIGYAKFHSRSHDAVIRVYDAAGNVIETHEHHGGFSRSPERLTDVSAPYVLQSNRVQPPRILATREEDYQSFQPDQIHRHRPVATTMLPNVCSTFGICLWSSAFASLCASVVLPSILNVPLLNCF